MSSKKNHPQKERWEPWQICLLEENCESIPVQQLVNLIGKTEAAIRMKASRMELYLNFEEEGQGLADWKYAHRLEKEKWDAIAEQYAT